HFVLAIRFFPYKLSINTGTQDAPRPICRGRWRGRARMQKRIEKLTPEQEARIPEFREEWLRHGLSTERADFDAAEAAIKDAYRVAGLEPPALFIRLRSPLEGA